MLRSTRSARLVAVATAATLTLAGLVGGAAAFADDVPTPDPTAPVDPISPFVHSDESVETTPQPAVEHHGLEPVITPTTSGNNFSSAVTLTGRYPIVVFDSTTATIQSGEPRKVIPDGWYLSRTMWAKWKAPENGYVTIRAYDGGFLHDMGINVYTGSTLTGLSRKASNNDQYYPVDGAGLSSGTSPWNSGILSLKVTKGKTYRIQVGSASGSKSATMPGFSAMVLAVTSATYFPENDYLANAKELKLGTGATVSTTDVVDGATIEGWEPTNNTVTPSAVRVGSIWYKWTAPQVGSTQFQVCSIDANPTIAVYGNSSAISGTGFGDMRSLAFDSGSGACFGGGSTVTVSVGKGVTYFIQVASVVGEDRNTATLQLFYTASAPYIEKVSPASGSRLGGNTVTITGQAFTSGGTPTVKFGTTSAHVISFSSTQVKVKAPAHGAGTVDVVVTSGVKSNKKHYTYL